MNNTEQWKTDGICEKCRREKYCSKPCTACKRRTKFHLNRTVAETMVRMMFGKE